MDSRSLLFDYFSKLGKRKNPIPILAPFIYLLELFLLLPLIIFWSSRYLSFLRATAAYLFNHHVVFLIGNAIILTLFLLCRHNGTTAVDDLYDEYVKHSHTAAAVVTDLLPPAEEGSGGGGGKDEEIVEAAVEMEMAVTIEKAQRLIQRFERTQSEKLKRDIIRTPTPRLLLLWRSETLNQNQNRFERLSSEEFRHTIDAFIHQNWNKTNNNNN